MTILVGSTNITDIQIGSTAINSVYVGANKVWDRGPAALDTQTVTVGLDTAGTLSLYGFDRDIWIHGSITDGTCNFKSGALYDAIDSMYNSNGGTMTTILYINGSQTNADWTTMTIAGYAYQRTDATYTQGSVTSWTWQVVSTVSAMGTTVGATKTVVFT